MFAIGYRQIYLHGRRAGSKKTSIVGLERQNLMSSRHQMSNTKTTVGNHNSHSAVDDSSWTNNDIHYMRLALRHAQVIMFYNYI